MTEELYDELETGGTFDALDGIAEALPRPWTLLGGWGVYLTVNDSFQKTYGVPYLGSRDIDIGFHIDTGMSVEELRTTPFFKAIETVKKYGYVPTGSYRYCKFVERETGRILDEAQAAGLPIQDLFYLYVDIMVDNIHPEHSKVFKSKPLDEPLLRGVFSGGTAVKRNYRNHEVFIPNPQTLLATKLKAIPERQKGDKIVKDACDIYALLWHSGVDYSTILSAVKRDYPDLCEKGRGAITDSVGMKAAHHLGIDIDRYFGVIGKIA